MTEPGRQSIYDGPQRTLGRVRQFAPVVLLFTLIYCAMMAGLKIAQEKLGAALWWLVPVVALGIYLFLRLYWGNMTAGN